MNEKERNDYSKFIHDTLDRKKESTDYARAQMLTSISHFREFCGTLLNTNVAVMAAVIAALLTDQFISTAPIYIGTVLLLLNAILLTFYQARVLVGENLRLHAWYEFLNNSHDEVVSLGYSHFHDGTLYAEFEKITFEKYKEFATQEKKMIKENKEASLSVGYMYLFCSLFVLGLIFLSLGFLDFNIPTFGDFLSYLCNCVPI